MKSYRYLIARRIIQLSILFLFLSGNYFGWKILIGNYSSAILLSEIPLSDPFAALQILISGFFVGSDVLIGAAIILFIYAILGNRVFCSWICPVNMLSDFNVWLREKTKFGNIVKFELSRNTRYYILGLSLLLSAILGFAAFEMISPISIFHRSIIFGIGGGWAIIAALFLFDFVIVKNGWCGHLCPLGAFYSLVGKYGIIKVEHDLDNCTSCNKCFEVCPEEQILDIIAISSGYIKSGECTNCGKCIEVCEDNALRFSRNYKKFN